MSSNYPNGFAQGVTIRGVPLTTTNPGQVFWVNNSAAIPFRGKGGSDGNPGTYQQPFSTVDYAISRCTANRGDIVAVMPGHNEGGSAAGLFDVDVAGVAVVGLGFGSARPTFDFDGTATTVIVSAANASLVNLNFRASVADVVTGVQVDSTNCRIDSCEFLEEASGDNFIDFIETSASDNAVDGLAVTSCKVVSADTGNNSFVELNAVTNSFSLVGNHIQLGVAAGESVVGVSSTSDAITGIYIADNDIFRLNTQDALIFEGTANADTGLIVRNMIGHADAAGPLLIPTGSDVRMCENYSAGADDNSGRLIPVVEST